MLKYIAVGADGKYINLTAPQSMVLCRDENTPADSLTAVFPHIISEELAEIYIYNEDSLVYRGVVDEQITHVGESAKTEIISRSMAALLLDNEAYPATFVDPSAELIFRRYLKPFGIREYVGGDLTYMGEFKVQKGSSCWQVAENFAKGAVGAFPRVDGDVLYFESKAHDKTVTFENKGKGLPYLSLEHDRLRCKLISCVKVKTAVGGEYSSLIENPNAVNRGIHRERYINATLLSSTPLSKADEIISNAKKADETVTLYSPLRLTELLGADAVVKDPGAGELRGFYVSGIRYSLSDKGEVTKLTLRKKEN